MEQYIKKSAVIAEIERLFEKVGNSLGEYRNGAEHTLISIKDFIDTLEVKGVDLEHLEQEVKDFCYKFDDRKDKWYDMTPHDKNIMISPTWSNFAMQLAKHFFALGLFSQLTWQDIRLISEIGEDFMNSEESDDLWKDEEVYYTAILNKLKEKGRDYKSEKQITRELEQKGEEA